MHLFVGIAVSTKRCRRVRPSCEVGGVGVAQRLVSGRQARKIHVVLVETRE